MGRSIGSGPAIHLCSLFQVGGLVLLSPFLSLCEVVDDLYGKLASALLKQRFNNKERVKRVSSPCLIVHGTRDKLVPDRHTTELCQYFTTYCKVKLLSNMSHSMFCHDQLFGEVRDFCRNIKLL